VGWENQKKNRKQPGFVRSVERGGVIGGKERGKNIPKGPTQGAWDLNPACLGSFPSSENLVRGGEKKGDKVNNARKATREEIWVVGNHV